MIGYYPNTLRETLFCRQDKFGFRRLSATKSLKTSEPSSTTAGSYRRSQDLDECDLSKSVDLGHQRIRAYTEESQASSFTQSVVVLPTGDTDGKYSIYTGVHQNQVNLKTENEHDVSKWLLSSREFGHNIGNTDLLQQRFENESDWSMRKQGLLNTGSKLSPKTEVRSPKNKVKNPPTIAKLNARRKTVDLGSNCGCAKYHSHTFKTNLSELARFHRTISQESDNTRPKRMQPEVVSGNTNHLTICNVFWKASLAFCGYKHMKKPVEFKSLWPSDSVIRSILHDGIEDTGLRCALWELCLLSLVNGPLSVLKNILEFKYIRVEYQCENDPGLLHLACLLQNGEAIQLLTQMGLSSKIKDKTGKTAAEVCFCNRTRKYLPVKYQTSILADRNKSSSTLRPGLQDKDAIFRLASNPKSFYEIQKKLQMFDFNVNTEHNEAGDHMIHIACRTGLCKLPLIMCLMKLQNCDIELCNTEGYTPLMIVARDGDSNLCDILLCVFGANPNQRNTRDGKTALHYAVMGNHVNVVNVLLERGGDVNLEDSDQCRPDDLLTYISVLDCQDVIQQHRAHRSQLLTQMVTQDTVYPIDVLPSDLGVIDTEGYTLVMQAALHDRISNLETLLGTSVLTINAQHGQTGLTALAMAAKAGHHKCCDVLLRFGASASISDIQGYLPLHAAVLNNQEEVLDVFMDYFPMAYVGLFKALRLCRKSSIHDKLTTAWEKRQEQIINPQLRMCAMEGDAEKLFCVLEDGDNVDSKSNLNNQSALFVAMENNHLEVVQLLIERGADVAQHDPQTGNTVLHIVAKTGSLDIAKYLLDYCRKPSLTQNQSRNTQYQSRSTGTQSRCRLDINAINNEHKTALQLAAENGYMKLISLLIEQGATTALLDHQGMLFTSPEFEGSRVQVEGHRLEHTRQVMTLVENKSKKALVALQNIWVPRFDHNLRNKHGDTPLMVACRRGCIEIVKFLLQSAVYVNHVLIDDSEDNSDTDSGVPDLPPLRSSPGSFMQDEFVRSIERSCDHLPLGASCLTPTIPTLNQRDFLNSLPCPLPREGQTISGTRLNSYLPCPLPREGQTASGTQLNSYLRDMECPKGLSIYHDGIVSHVCAVNLHDGNTPLHWTIEGGDNSSIATALLDTDGTVINMQNDAGLTPIHLACKLTRKKIVANLLTIEGLDLSLRSLDGLLAEEMTHNKSLIKLVKTARGNLPTRHMNLPGPSQDKGALTESLPSLSSYGGGSTINFEKIEHLYQSMRQSKNYTSNAKGSS